jgi:hypothetical protein
MTLQEVLVAMCDRWSVCTHYRQVAALSGETNGVWVFVIESWFYLESSRKYSVALILEDFIISWKCGCGEHGVNKKIILD